MSSQTAANLAEDIGVFVIETFPVVLRGIGHPRFRGIELLDFYGRERLCLESFVNQVADDGSESTSAVAKQDSLVRSPDASVVVEELRLITT